MLSGGLMLLVVEDAYWTSSVADAAAQSTRSTSASRQPPGRSYSRLYHTSNVVSSDLLSPDLLSSALLSLVADLHRAL